MPRSSQILGCFVILPAAWSLLTGCHCQHSRLMSFEAYNRLTVSSPYILMLRGGGGELIYYGIEHTACPQHPDLLLLEKMWGEFHPTLALTEGGVWPLLESREAAIGCYGEGGLARFLAERDGVPIRSLDPPREEEVQGLLPQFSGESIKAFFILRQVPPGRHCLTEAQLNENVQKTMTALSEIPDLRGPPTSLAELDEFCQKHLALEGWRLISADLFDPSSDLTILNRVARSSSRIRDEFMIRQIQREVKSGEKVFAVAGYTHVVMQERALRKALAGAP